MKRIAALVVVAASLLLQPGAAFAASKEQQLLMAELRMMQQHHRAERHGQKKGEVWRHCEEDRVDGLRRAHGNGPARIAGTDARDASAEDASALPDDPYVGRGRRPLRP